MEDGGAGPEVDEGVSTERTPLLGGKRVHKVIIEDDGEKGVKSEEEGNGTLQSTPNIQQWLNASRGPRQRRVRAYTNGQLRLDSTSNLLRRPDVLPQSGRNESNQNEMPSSSSLPKMHLPKGVFKGVLSPFNPIWGLQSTSGPSLLWWMMLTSLLWTMVIDPYRVAFLESGARLPYGGAIFAGTIFADAIFAMEMILSFARAIPARFEGKDFSFNSVHPLHKRRVLEGMITDRYSIASKYARGSLWMDLIAFLALPFEIYLLYGRDNVTPFSLVAFLRMIRSYKLPQITFKLSIMDGVNYYYFFFFQKLFLVFFGMHISACVFYLIAKLEGFGDDSWIMHYAEYLLDDDASLLDKYVTSLYWSATTLSTTGYGDIAAVSVAEKAWTVFVMIAGFGLQAYVLGNLTTLFLWRTSSIGNYRLNLNQLNDFMSRNKFPKKFRQAMRHQLRINMLLRDDLNADENMLSNYPVLLQKKVIRFLYSPVLDQTYVFKGTSSYMRNTLISEMGVIRLMPTTVIVSPSTPTDELYVILEGAVEYSVKDGQDKSIVTNIGIGGDVFGESVLLNLFTNKYTREAWTCTSITMTKVLTIKKTALGALLETCPDDERIIHSNILCYFKDIIDSIESDGRTTVDSLHSFLGEVAKRSGEV